MKSKILGLLAVGLLAGPIASQAGVIVDTGPPVGSTGNAGGNGDRAGQFTMGSAFVIDSIESFATVTTAGNVTVSIYSNVGGLPGGTALFATVIALPATAGAWLGTPSGLDWALAPGTYWAAMERRNTPSPASL